LKCSAAAAAGLSRAGGSVKKDILCLRKYASLDGSFEFQVERGKAADCDSLPRADRSVTAAGEWSFNNYGFIPRSLGVIPQ
jgi:hypothetical protein